MGQLFDNTNVTSINGKIVIPGSKSESNRLLILQQFFPKICIENLSTSDDTQLLKKALQTSSNTIDIGNAGTAMRFLTAFFAIQNGRTVMLTGSQRMQERPIKILVDALCALGASITYLKNEGYPPLLIKGKALSKNKIVIKGNVSSQYISALLLIAPALSDGLTIQLEGAITSKPYIEMTLSLLQKIGVHISSDDNSIKVYKPKTFRLSPKTFFIDPDWSSASYFYSLVALQANAKVELVGFKKNNLQGDSVLPEIYKQFGVRTTFTKTGIILNNENLTSNSSLLTFNLIDTPDLAQTIAVTCLGLGINCCLTGLKTLKIKETDRLQALKNELEKLGALVKITNESLEIMALSLINRDCIIKTYDDHRMAMAFAPLSVKVPLAIENPEVVSKSYPTYWEDLFSLV